MNNNLKRYIEITRQSKLTDFQINFYDEIGIKTINDFKKSEQYQAISDMSKELHGSRLRLDIDKYSLEELIEIEQTVKEFTTHLFIQIKLLK